jgi:hypothetical protein
MGEDQRWIEDADVYHPRNPKDSPLWHLLDSHYEGFEQRYEERFEREYGFFRPIISEVVRDYLKCGDLKKGFARVRCPECKYEYLLAFSCRGRWFCPSCHAKKVILFGEHLCNEVLFPVPHRHYVFSLPIIIRRYFKYDRDLLTKLCNCVNASLLTFLRTVIGLPDGLLGAVMAIHTFGDYAKKWHPHIHLIVADGLFTRSGTFYVMPRGIDLTPLAGIFRANVLSMLKKEGKIDDAFIRMLMGWRHTSGFSVDNGVRITRDDDEGKERLAQYILRNPFSIEKLTYNEETGTVIYHSKMTHGKNKKNFEVFAAEEFIAAITQYIPEKSFQMVRYYGWYSNRSRGEREKGVQRSGDALAPKPARVEVLDVSDYKPRRIPSKTWRECIKKVWEADPLQCPRCQAEMKIVSFIADPETIRLILEHRKLWKDPVRKGRAPPNATPPASSRIHYEPCDNDWPGYEEPCITLE